MFLEAHIFDCLVSGARCLKVFVSFRAPTRKERVIAEIGATSHGVARMPGVRGAGLTSQCKTTERLFHRHGRLSGSQVSPLLLSPAVDGACELDAMLCGRTYTSLIVSSSAPLTTWLSDAADEGWQVHS